MTASLENLTKDLAELRLKHFEKAFTVDMATFAPTERERVVTLMERWIRKELSERKSSAIQNRVRSAKFVKVQTIDQFKFDRNAIPKSTLELCDPLR